MTELKVGDRAPAFRLPSAQGPEVGLEDYRGRKVILLFAKGMACGFCRQKMSQLGRAVPQFRERGAEVVQIAPTTVDRGRFYARNFPLPFPYLCDPDYEVFRTYGLQVRPHSVAWKVMGLWDAFRSPQPEVTELGKASPALGELPRLLNDDDLGFFILDEEAIVRYARTGSYIVFEGDKAVGPRRLPSNEEILLELKS